MAYLDPHLMGVFRRKMRNPANMWRSYHFMRGFRGGALRTPAGAYGAVDGLSGMLGVPITPAQRANAANWLMQCRMDPANRGHCRAAWRMIHHY